MSPSGNRKAPVGEPGGDSVLISVNREPAIDLAQPSIQGEGRLCWNCELKAAFLMLGRGSVCCSRNVKASSLFSSSNVPGISTQTALTHDNEDTLFIILKIIGLSAVRSLIDMWWPLEPHVCFEFIWSR